MYSHIGRYVVSGAKFQWPFDKMYKGLKTYKARRLRDIIVQFIKGCGFY
jgi:hypothetical protein